MSGGTGYPTTMSGTSSATETFVAILSPWRKGAPNSNGTAPTPKARATYLRETRISNKDAVATNTLLVRINRAAAQVTLKGGETLKIDKAIVHSISIQAGVGTPAWDIIGVAA